MPLIFIFYLYFLSFHSVIAQSNIEKKSLPNWHKKIWKESVVLDFENEEYSNQNWRYRGPQDQSLPDIFVTRNITAPIPGSRKALLMRFSEKSNLPGQFIFPNPPEIYGYLKQITVPVYSSKSNGSLFIILQSYDYENTKIFLTNLNFRGWKFIEISIQDRFNQNDPVLNSFLPIRIIGILYEPEGEIKPGIEILVGIDDISILEREKYKLLKEPEALLE